MFKMKPLAIAFVITYFALPWPFKLPVETLALYMMPIGFTLCAAMAYMNQAGRVKQRKGITAWLWVLLAIDMFTDWIKYLTI